VDWALCESFIVVLLGALEDGLPGGGALNVNLPGRPPAEPARIGWRPLSIFGTTTGSLDRRVDDDGHIHLRMRYQANGDLPPANTDTGAVLRGDATLTWIPLPHGRPAPEDWRRRLLRRIRTGWSRCSVGRVSHPDGPAVTTPTR
jgi:hypothetical protein